MFNTYDMLQAVTPTEKSFRPSHRASVHGSILHDASYLGLIEIKGPEQVLRSILDRCTDCQGPSASAQRFV
jgi:ribonuclease P/MRP protein subunit POP1